METTGGKRNQHRGISASSLTPHYFICLTKPALLSTPQELKPCWDLICKKSLAGGHLHGSAQTLEQTLNPASKGIGKSLARAPEPRLGHWRRHCSQYPRGGTQQITLLLHSALFLALQSQKQECLSAAPYLLLNQSPPLQRKTLALRPIYVAGLCYNETRQKTHC